MEEKSLQDRLIEFIAEKVWNSLDNIANEAVSEVEGYNADWCTEEEPYPIEDLITQIAEHVSDDLLQGAPEASFHTPGYDKEDDSIEESLLTEKAWEHQLSMGAEIREAISEADIPRLKQLLVDAMKEVNEIQEDTFTEDEIEEVEELSTESMDYDDEDEMNDAFDYYLSELYDVCDNLNIWIPFVDNVDGAEEEFEDEETFEEEEE